MENKTIVVEQNFPVSASIIWDALTSPEKMKEWYFDLPDFKPELGCEFSFWGGPAEDRQYKHLCKITEVIPKKKIAYTWQYEGYPGLTEVSFELTESSDSTTVKLSHTGLESFPTDVPDFARKNFVEGWTWIIKTSLSEYIKNNK